MTKMNEHPLLIATEDGLVISEGRAWRKTLQGTPVTSVIAREGVILAGTPQGVLRSDDLGESWEVCNEGLTSQQVRWLAFHPAVSDLEFVGTSTAVFMSRDGARTWQPLAAAEVGSWQPALLGAGAITAVTTMGE